MMIGCSLVLAIIFTSFVSGYQPPKKTTVQCYDDVDCTSMPHTFCLGNTAYSSGVCSCNNQYVLRQQGNNFECLEEAQLFEDPCQIDDQCKPKFGESAACIRNKCKCSPAAHFINLKCWKSSKLGETCGNPNNCVATEHSQCNGKCSCVSGYIGNPGNTKCLKVANNLGDGCEESVQCTSANSLASCQFNVCLCPQGYIAQGNNCFKKANKLNDPCQINNQCTKFGLSATCIRNKCQCNPGTHFINSICWKSSKLGEMCSSSNNCVAEHSQCTGICRCLPGYSANSANTKCLRIAQQMGESCENSAQCTSLNQYATCQFNVCACPQGYISHGNKCLAVATYINSPCQINEQCKSFGEHASCIQNTCKCSPWAYFNYIESKCYLSRKLGETCSSPSNCVVPYSVCYGICSCMYGFAGNPGNNKCLRIAGKLGDPCEDSVQCTAVNPKASCQYNVCSCPEGYSPEPNNVCTRTALSREELLKRIPPGYEHVLNSATGLKESIAVIFTALVMLIVNH